MNKKGLKDFLSIRHIWNLFGESVSDEAEFIRLMGEAAKVNPDVAGRRIIVQLQ